LAISIGKLKCLFPTTSVQLPGAAEAVKDAARAWAGGTGGDLVVDPIGGALAEPALRALGDRGRYLVIGFASGDIPWCH
jgi:NADPH:quinone reductase-like Zn-dependent oxidoreductase